MIVISRIYATPEAARAALAAVGLDPSRAAGSDAAGARYDLVVTPLSAPTGRMLDGPPGSAAQIAEMAVTGYQIDLWWQGATPPALTGGTLAEAPAASLAPPAASAPAVPDQVTLFQGRTVMRRTPNPKGQGTLFDAVDAYVNANLAAHPEFYEAWNYSNHILRRGGIVAALAPAFGLTDAQIDALFIAASHIEG